MVLPEGQGDIAQPPAELMTIAHDRAIATTGRSASEGVDAWQRGCPAPTAIFTVPAGIHWITVATNPTIAVGMWGAEVMPNLVGDHDNVPYWLRVVDLKLPTNIGAIAIAIGRIT